jgi:Glycosyl hydrolase catalytic core
MRHPTLRDLILIALTGLWLLVLAVLVLRPAAPAPIQQFPSTRVPATPTATPGPQIAPLPRGYGVAVAGDKGSRADLDLLGPVWYYDYHAVGADWGSHPRILMVRPADKLSDAELRHLAAIHPGHWWMLGNEPNDPAQDNQEPAAYARFYAHTTAVIRAADPTAGIMPAGIANADTQWAAAFRTQYEQMTGAPPQVDAWNIHNYLLDTADPYDLGEFQRRIGKFRAWMAAVGDGDRPLVLSEFGVRYGAGCCNRPLDVLGDGLVFMRRAITWLEESGQVESWAWFTLDSGDLSYDGNLLRPAVPGTLSPYGRLYGDHARMFALPR